MVRVMNEESYVNYGHLTTTGMIYILKSWSSESPPLGKEQQSVVQSLAGECVPGDGTPPDHLSGGS